MKACRAARRKATPSSAAASTAAGCCACVWRSWYGESTVAKILDLVENAGEKKAKAENFITKFARWYTPAVVIAALALL